MNFQETHKFFTDLIESDQNFALARYQDGEVALMQNRGITRQTQAYQADGWDAPAKATKVGKELIEGLSHTESNYYYGIPGKNDAERLGDYNYLTSIITTKNITYGNLFINANYNKTKTFFNNLKKPVNLIASERGDTERLPFEVESFCPFPKDCVNWWEVKGDEFILLMKDFVYEIENELFLIAVGPVTGIIIDKLYQVNPNNQYVDVGSALDELFFGVKTRPYMHSTSPYASHESTFDIDVNVRDYNLSSYLVPEELKGGKCVDIGANVGCFTDKYKDFFSIIHYYEPFTACYEKCSSKLKDAANVTGYNEGVFSEPSTQYLVRHENNDSGSSAVKSELINFEFNPKDVLQEIKCVDFDTILKRIGGKIDYLKCDCETSEYWLLMKHDLSVINYIAIELHWQMGIEKFTALTDHIKKTHELLPGNTDQFTVGRNTECVYRLKA